MKPETKKSGKMIPGSINPDPQPEEIKQDPTSKKSKRSNLNADEADDESGKSLNIFLLTGKSFGQ